MIFRPYREIRVAGISFQGLLPRRKKDLAKSVGDTIEKELISHADIQRVMNDTQFHTQVVEKITAAVEKVINTYFKNNPMLSAFITPETLTAIVDMFRTQIEEETPRFLESIFERMEEKINFKEVVEEKIIAFDMRKLESIVYSIAAREMKAIEYFGAFLGGVVGIIQVGIIIIAGA
jgi:uncharacterized membrane protein YheB (UPF0754 family)